MGHGSRWLKRLGGRRTRAELKELGWARIEFSGIGFISGICGVEDIVDEAACCGEVIVDEVACICCKFSVWVGRCCCVLSGAG